MKVRLLKTCAPIYYNLEKWDLTQSPLLLITGLSGAGKTTLAKKIAKRYHAICVSFDVLKFYPEASKESQMLLDIFLQDNPEIKKYICIKWAKTDSKNSNDILFNYYCNAFFDFLIEYGQQHKKKIVLEGIQMFVRMHPSKSIGLPIIIIRSSSIKSFFYKLKREVCQNSLVFQNLFKKHLIADTYTYYIKQRKLLNIYIIYLSIIYKSI